MTDLEFVQRCVTGDRLAWNQFVDKYSRLIYKYIHSVLNTTGTEAIFSQDNISDLFQEIFLSLIEDDFRKLKGFQAKNGCTLASWLRQIVINRTIDYIRKQRPLISLDLEANDSESGLKETLATSGISSSEALVVEEKMSQLQDCIDTLDTEDKYFLELHINQGLGIERLKDIFKATRGALDMRKSRIIERLKKCFKSKGFMLDI
jgi:RNA polymerase sigma factor (sigma-70 family)